jgi:ABC-type methionine transport system ATPase subunit
MARREETARFKLVFPERVLGEPIIHRLSHDFRVVPNIQRGRIAEKSAWLEIEVVGSRRNIQRALKFLEAKGVSVTPL